MLAAALLLSCQPLASVAGRAPCPAGRRLPRRAVTSHEPGGAGRAIPLDHTTLHR